jgi:hypothetical protein
MNRTPFRIGPSTHSQGGRLAFGFYVADAGGGLALICERAGQREYVATVNLAPYGSRPLAENEVWLKGWSENEGVPEALEKAGIVKLTSETMPTGFVEAQLAIVSDEVMAYVRRSRR